MTGYCRRKTKKKQKTDSTDYYIFHSLPRQNIQIKPKWNDVFIWPSSVDNPGVLVDAGMVFLPETTLVDPETGSKYTSEMRTAEGEEKRVMIEDEKLISAFVK